MLHYSELKIKGSEDMTSNSNQQNWEIWKGQVSGSKKQIQDALKVLNRDPNNAAELQKIINRQMQANLGQVLDEADKGRKYTPY